MLATQFKELMYGDRLYYENIKDNATRFTVDQIAQINRTGIGRIYCDHLELGPHPANPWILINSGNTNTCQRRQGIDFSYWKETPPSK